jgi:redox-sensing transcriptional repressor
LVRAIRAILGTDQVWLVAAGIEGIVNFAPVTINLPENVSRVGVDLAIELEQLSFSVVKNSDSG